ncbi:unnamed protein product [Rotaria magnacalcarata]|uniref:G-protein coupled receptors family 1 profile domain-containing protein n=1 Tax=Rotaria magnacalcarata TaxID=392030 RepID=A0A819MFN1_9BILA|nr:unnamed protein product [Rotaria magnacalcarata]
MTTLDLISCTRKDDMGYNVVPMYRVLFIISCVTVPLGIILNMVFIVVFVCKAKHVLNVKNQALFLSCIFQALITFVQGPIRTYFYYHHGCLPIAGTPLCQLTVYFDYIPTQINDFLVAHLSIERLVLILKPFAFHRGHRRHITLAIYLHYASLFVAIVFPCLYYPIIMQNGAATINIDDPSTIQICDMWYQFLSKMFS